MTDITIPKTVSRRSFGAMSLMVPAIAGLAGARYARAASSGQFSDERVLVNAVRKMRSRTDGGLRSGWLEAKRFAYIDGEITPLLILLAGTISTSRDNGDGTFDINVVETTYYLDVETRELLDTLAMPGTGKIVKVPLYRSGPAAVTVGAKTAISELATGEEGVVSEGGEDAPSAFAPKGDVKLERSVGPAVIDGNTVWIQTEEYGRVFPADPKDARVFYKESAIWQGKMDELLDPDVVAASAKLSYSAASSWRPWMEMGDIKGHTMSSGIGATCDSLSDMHEEWLRLTRIHHPDILDNPEGVLRGET
ncbi:MAG: DUF1838 family protein [Rhodospirillaceae bacterium]|nr:DUF1838 family protein [Rhodospirillaceae bacterium]